MNANELRIYNWVMFNGSPFCIAGGSIIDSGHKDFEPIPLTPEILEKARFELYDEENNRFIKDGFHYYDGCLWFGTSQVDIKYLHQLQNLYFALTGEELEINL